MATFPVLSSTAVMQYPAPLARVRAGRIVRFIDGSDQRFIALGKTLRSWQIKLTLLNEQELGQIEAFFDAQDGEYLPFDFPDPFSGAIVPNCRFSAPTFVTGYQATDVGAASFWVIETNG
ncbi:MAG TPA: hypothetical protein VK493_14105 [Bryobacteraceae bacterium]|nr:hypothetical protein [Bryobacteraceae bacterium]